MGECTLLLERIQEGDPNAAEELLPLVYGELRKLAALRMARELPGQTLQATALVHEAWMRLVGSTQAGKSWDGRGHFFAAAAEAMRRILVDRARQKRRIRHGGELQRVDLDQVNLAVGDEPEAVLAIHDAVERLELESPHLAEIVKLRYFAGMDHQEIAASLGVSEPTVRRRWAYARAWLYAELRKESSLG